MLQLAALPAADVLRHALFKKRRKEVVRIFIVLLCLASCRRGRKTVAYTVRKAVSPISFLLWCLGVTRRRDASHLLRADGGIRRQRRGWKGALGGRRETLAVDAVERGALTDDETSSKRRLATLGEAGRSAAFTRLRQLQQEGACCDVMLAVGGQHFKAHKCVLAAQSLPLRAMFEGAFKEGNESVIALRDVGASSFALLLDFLYDRSVIVNPENVESLLDLSARYGVSLLRRHCCAFLTRSANPSNACALLAVADRYDCHRLKRELFAYILECFSLACCGSGAEGFCQLPVVLLVEVLKDDRLVTEDGEVSVFWAAVSWLEAEKSRRRDADEVLAHVRFGLISAKTIADAVESHPLLQTKAGKAFVHEAYRYQALPPESREEFASCMAARARPRATSVASGSAVDGVAGACGKGLMERALRPADCDEETSSTDENHDKDYRQDNTGSGHMEEIGVCAATGNNSSKPSRKQQQQQHGDTSSSCDERCDTNGGALRAAPASGRTKETTSEGAEEQDNVHRSGTNLGASGKESTSFRPLKRSWGAGLRMYV